MVPHDAATDALLWAYRQREEKPMLERDVTDLIREEQENAGPPMDEQRLIALEQTLRRNSRWSYVQCLEVLAEVYRLQLEVRRLSALLSPPPARGEFIDPFAKEHAPDCPGCEVCKT